MICPQTVSGNGQNATCHYHATRRVLERVTYTKEGETTPWLESTRKHDTANRLTRITTHVDDAGVMKAVDHHAYGYDSLDRIGSHADMIGAAWTYGYNAKGEVGKAVKKLPGGSTEVNGRAYRYHFDGIGNRTLVEQSRDSGQTARSFGYTPDALNQYSAITHPSFVDVAGSAAPASTVTVNTASVTRQGGYFRKELTEDNSSGPQWIEAAITDGTTTTDGSLALPAASVTPQYDEDGNLKSDGLWTYTWDAENRLIRCERNAALVTAGAPYLKLEYDYDSQSRRIRTSTFTSSGASTPASQTLFVFDGWKCIAELDALAGDQPIRKYTWGLDLAGDIGDSSTGNVGALLWLVDTATNKTHVHLYDSNGNVSGLVDATTRKRSATYDYDAFGQMTVCYGDYAKKNPFGFSTKHTDFATGLLYYGYRWYSPFHGRWISRDPIEEEGGVNLYGFVDNNSPNLFDVLGMDRLKLRYVLETQDEIAGAVKDAGGTGFTSLRLMLDDAKKKVAPYSKTGKNSCHCIEKIDLYTHGSEGFILFPDGGALTGSDLEDYRTTPSKQAPEMAHFFKEILLMKELNALMCETSTIDIHSCSSGRGESGEKLLNEMQHIFPGKTIILHRGFCQVKWGGLIEYETRWGFFPKKIRKTPKK